MRSLLSQSGSDFALGDISSTSGGSEMASKAGQQSGPSQRIQMNEDVLREN